MLFILRLLHFSSVMKLIPVRSEHSPQQASVYYFHCHLISVFVHSLISYLKVQETRLMF